MMDNPFPKWIEQITRDGAGPVHLPSITRGLACQMTLFLAGDFSNASFALKLKASPDAAAALAEYTCTPGAFSGGVTPLVLSLAADALDGQVPDTNADGIETLVHDIVCTPSGGLAYRMFAGYQAVSGAVS